MSQFSPPPPDPSHPAHAIAAPLASDSFRHSEQLWRGVFENSVVGVALAAPDGRMLAANARLQRLLGYSEQELRAMTFLSFTHPDDQIPTTGALTALVTGHCTVYRMRKRCVRKDGGFIWTETSLSSVPPAAGEPMILIGVITDITDRVEAEDALYLLVNVTAEASTAPDIPSMVTACLRRVCEARGWELGQAWFPNADGSALVCATDSCVLAPGTEAFRAASLQAAFPRGVGLPGRVWASNTAHWVVDVGIDQNFPRRDVARATGLKGAFAFPVTLGDEPLAVFEFFARDLRVPDPACLNAVEKLGRHLGEILERKRTEAALRESEVSYRSLVERAPVGIYRSSVEGRFLSANAALARMLDYTIDELLQLDMARDVYADPTERQRLLRGDRHTDREYSDVETTWKRKDGLPLTVQLSVRAVRNAASAVEYYETVVRDVTEQRRLQVHLTQVQKMEAVGRLAGGIAHDFNNLLTVIMSYSDLLLEDLAPDDPKQEDLGQVRKAAEAAAALTRQLLAFSRQQVLQPKVLDVNVVVADTERMLKRLIGDDIQLVAQLASEVGSVKADPGQLEQVVMNLAVNARDAMPAGGRLTIETANVEMDEAYVHDHPLAQPGHYVMLAVSDTGIGMDEKTKARIFEPFFTTKEVGKGTGLGLATVYGIVKQSGGFVWVYSEPGQGTTFKVYLPRVDESAEQRAAPAGAAALPRGTETILVVEDAPAVRDVVRQVLERQGYRVLEAPNGEAAEHLATKHHGPIHLLLTDVVMPGISGRRLAEQLARPRPEMLVLYASGYTDDSVVRHGVLEAGVAYLQKPFTPNDLARKVRAVLDSSPHPAAPTGR